MQYAQLDERMNVSIYERELSVALWVRAEGLWEGLKDMGLGN